MLGRDIDWYAEWRGDGTWWHGGERPNEPAQIRHILGGKHTPPGDVAAWWHGVRGMRWDQFAHARIDTRLIQQASSATLASRVCNDRGEQHTLMGGRWRPAGGWSSTTGQQKDGLQIQSSNERRRAREGARANDWRERNSTDEKTRSTEVHHDVIFLPRATEDSRYNNSPAVQRANAKVGQGIG
jgi:hypothetical protein